MGRPLLFIDFDGVINQFPDPKVMRRQGTTDWMRPDDPRRAAYAPDNWFRPERGARGPIGRPGCGQMVAVHLAAGDSAIEPGVGRGLADRPMV